MSEEKNKPENDAEDGEKVEVVSDAEQGAVEEELPAGEGSVDTEGSEDAGEDAEAEDLEEKRIVNVEGEKKVVTSEGDVNNWENERQYFRVFFPDAETPTITIDDLDYEVVDASEKGVKFKKPEGECLLEADQEVSGRLTLRTGDTCVVEGKVLRILPSMIVLLLTQGVPFKLLMSEQRRFISIYKHVYKGE